MPSVMVLVLGDDASLSTVVDEVVAGAKRVRFTEVTTRAAQPDVFRYRVIDSDTSLASFDGIVVVASDDESATPQLERMRGDQPLTNTVLSSVGSGAALTAGLVGWGGIVVSAPTASGVGERVAKVAGWVRHALGHEAEHHHHHHHAHEHDHHH